MTAPLTPGYLFLSAASGDNDGLVPATSQRWGDVLAEVPADHWAQVGWSRRFDALSFYEQLMTDLRGRGL